MTAINGLRARAVCRDIADGDPLLPCGIKIQIVVSGTGLTDQLYGSWKFAGSGLVYRHFLCDDNIKAPSMRSKELFRCEVSS